MYGIRFDTRLGQDTPPQRSSVAWKTRLGYSLNHGTPGYTVCLSSFRVVSSACCKAKTLGLGSALMICSGYYGELIVTGDLTPRWFCWALSMCSVSCTNGSSVLLMDAVSLQVTEQVTEQVSGFTQGFSP